MADYGDPTASAPSPLDTRYQALVAGGIPPNVAASMVYSPSYSEGQNPYFGWPTPYAGQDVEARSRRPPPSSEAIVRPGIRIERQDISYQPGASGMAGGWGNPGGSAPGMGGGLSPDMLKRIQLYQLLMQNRGTGGMQFGQGGGATNPLANPGQQGGGLIAALLQNPQLLQYFMQQSQGGQPGQFPQGGGGITLAQLLGAPQQATGQLT